MLDHNNLSVLTVRAAENQNVTTNPFTVTGGTEGNDYTFVQNDTTGATLTVTSSKPLTISGGAEGSPITGQIAVAAGVKTNLTLNGLYLTGVGASRDNTNKNAVSAIDLTATSELTLTLAANSVNKLTGGTTPDNGIGGPGIHVPGGAMLTVQGSGKLEVTGGSSMAGYSGNGGVGIGGAGSSDGNGESCGSVTILDGTVTVTGGGISAVGIGGGGSSGSGGDGGSGGTVVITGGTVTVTGGSSAAGIGGGAGSGAYGSGSLGGSGGTVVITGGTVSVTGGNNAVGICGGFGGTGQRNTTGTAVVLGANVTVSKISSNYFSASILPVTDGYQITGSLTLPDLVSEYTIPAGKTLTGSSGSLTIPDGVTLTVEDGATVDSGLSITNNGTVKIDCQNKDVSVDGKTELIHNWSNKDGSCINCGAKHNHVAGDWTYAKGTAENTIIATCGVCHKEALVTLTAPTDLTYDGTAKTATVTITPEGLLKAPKITYSEKGNISAGEVTASIKLGDVTAAVPYTIAKASPVITVPTATFNKTFGDTAFKLGVTDNNPEADATYTSGNTNVATVSSDGTVSIKGVGSATITVSLGETLNCNAAANKTITMNVNKASAPTLAPENKSYVNTKGSGGAVTIDVAGKLPKEKGVTTYSLTNQKDDNSILENVAVDTTGKLTYTVKSGMNIGDKASITVTAEMANYEPAKFTVNISITDKRTSSSSGSTGTGDTDNIPNAEDTGDIPNAMEQIDTAMENLKITKDIKAEEMEKVITDAIGESNVEYTFQMVPGDKMLTVHVEVFKTVNGEKVSRDNTYRFFFDKFVTKDGKKYFTTGIASLQRTDTFRQMSPGMDLPILHRTMVP